MDLLLPKIWTTPLEKYIVLVEVVKEEAKNKAGYLQPRY